MACMVRTRARGVLSAPYRRVSFFVSRRRAAPSRLLPLGGTRAQRARGRARGQRSGRRAINAVSTRPSSEHAPVATQVRCQPPTWLATHATSGGPTNWPAADHCCTQPTVLDSVCRPAPRAPPARTRCPGSRRRSSRTPAPRHNATPDACRAVGAGERERRGLSAIATKPTASSVVGLRRGAAAGPSRCCRPCSPPRPARSARRSRHRRCRPACRSTAGSRSPPATGSSRPQSWPRPATDRARQRVAQPREPAHRCVCRCRARRQHRAPRAPATAPSARSGRPSATTTRASRAPHPQRPDQQRAAVASGM